MKGVPAGDEGVMEEVVVKVISCWLSMSSLRLRVRVCVCVRVLVLVGVVVVDQCPGFALAVGVAGVCLGGGRLAAVVDKDDAAVASEFQAGRLLGHGCAECAFRWNGRINRPLSERVSERVSEW